MPQLTKGKNFGLSLSSDSNNIGHLAQFLKNWNPAKTEDTRRTRPGRHFLTAKLNKNANHVYTGKEQQTQERNRKIWKSQKLYKSQLKSNNLKARSH